MGEKNWKGEEKNGKERSSVDWRSAERRKTKKKVENEKNDNNRPWNIGVYILRKETLNVDEHTLKIWINIMMIPVSW